MTTTMNSGDNYGDNPVTFARMVVVMQITRDEALDTWAYLMRVREKKAAGFDQAEWASCRLAAMRAIEKLAALERAIGTDAVWARLDNPENDNPDQGRLL